ncbi:MAG: hypothetical protein RSB04_11300 [Gordonibacter sp.]|uniref:hypothetical protein n=1 Tax=Gordonibacter sp. TaxID=1968902 RepID=UPI002FCBF294
MSGKFVIKKERSKYRFDILDESGEVVFKGAIGSTKDAVVRKIDLMKSFGANLVDHLQAVEGRNNAYVIRGEEHSAREGEQGRVGDAIPLGFGTAQGAREEVLLTKDAILAACNGASVEDQTGE